MSAYKYKIGQKVCARSDLEPYKPYHMKSGPGRGLRQYAVDDMLQWKGKQLTISEQYTDGYRVKEDYEVWCWTDEMFEALPVKSFICKSLL